MCFKITYCHFYHEYSVRVTCQVVKKERFVVSFFLDKTTSDFIKFKNYEIAEGKKYYKLRLNRMEKAKSDYKKSLEVSDISGLFIRDLILGDIKNDDPRLR